MKKSIASLMAPLCIFVCATSFLKKETTTATKEPEKPGTYIGWRTGTGSNSVTYVVEYTISTPSNSITSVRVFNNCLQFQTDSYSGTVSYHTPGYYVNNGFTVNLSYPTGVTVSVEGYLTDGNPCNESLNR